MKVLSKTKRITLFSALILFSGMANLSIKVIPFKVIIKFLSNTEGLVDADLDRRQIHRLRLVILDLKKIEGVVPWRVKCFEQAIVIMLICRLMGISVNMFFGVKKDHSGGLKAHAWTKIGDVGLTGVSNAYEYHEVYKRGYMRQ